MSRIATCLRETIQHSSSPDFVLLFFCPQVKLKRRRIKLQQAIQERLSNVEKVKLSVDLSGDNPTEAWGQKKELISQLEEEISELQRRHNELEQLSQTEDNLHFLQVCVTVERQQIIQINH